MLSGLSASAGDRRGKQSNIAMLVANEAREQAHADRAV
jgi:hypothetical protein